MFRLMPPYERTAMVAAGLLVLILLLQLLLDWKQVIGLNYLTWGLTVYVLAATLVKFVTLVREWRAGRLFLLKGGSLVMPVAALAAVIWQFSTAFEGWAEYEATPVVFSIFLFQSLQQLRYVRLDRVSLRKQTRPYTVRDVALFNIEHIADEGDALFVRVSGGDDITLLRRYFFDRDWERLRRGLMGG